MKTTEYSTKMLVSALVPIVVFALAALNNFLLEKGLPCLEFGDGAITQTVTNIVEYAAAVWAWWKNNNVTPEAQAAQGVLNGLKHERD